MPHPCNCCRGGSFLQRDALGLCDGSTSSRDRKPGGGLCGFSGDAFVAGVKVEVIQHLCFKLSFVGDLFLFPPFPSRFQALFITRIGFFCGYLLLDSLNGACICHTPMDSKRFFRNAS